MSGQSANQTRWPKPGAPRAAGIAIAAMIAVAAAHNAHAELVNCANLSSNPGDYKVVLDDFGFGSTPAKNNAGLQALKERLQFNLGGQLEALRLAAAKLDKNLQVPLRLVFCAGRQPSVNGQEFTDELAGLLNNERVVVEAWGIFDVAPGAAATAAPLATVGYVIPPVQQYILPSVVRPIQVIRYPKRGGGAREELENFPELSAFALVGLGTKAARASRYDLAVWAFSRAETGISDAKLGGPNPDLDALLSYVRSASCQTRVKAQADTNYQGALRLVPAPKGGCP